MQALYAARDKTTITVVSLEVRLFEQKLVQANITEYQRFAVPFWCDQPVSTGFASKRTSNAESIAVSFLAYTVSVKQPQILWPVDLISVWTLASINRVVWDVFFWFRGWLHEVSRIVKIVQKCEIVQQSVCRTRSENRALTSSAATMRKRTRHYPLNTICNNNVVIKSKWRNYCVMCLLGINKEVNRLLSPDVSWLLCA